MKMVNWKKDGKVICSEPKQRATHDNAYNISLQLGVSIHSGKREYDLSNYNVQFEHHDDQFPPKMNNVRSDMIGGKDSGMIMTYPILKLVTDKILLNSITQFIIVFPYLLESLNQI